MMKAKPPFSITESRTGLVKSWCALQGGSKRVIGWLTTTTRPFKGRFLLAHAMRFRESRDERDAVIGKAIR